MDKKKGLLNVTIAITFKVILLIGSILVRRFLIKYIGNEVNGLNSLFLSIIGVLAVAELGVGSAITFCMYKPIVEGDNDKVSSLYHLFTKLYLIIGAIILIAGCAVMPFLKYLAKDYQDINVNLYITFGLMLVSVVLSYLFSSKTSLINAYKNNYITTLIANGGMVIQYALQIAAVILFQSFEAYLICRIISVLLQWGITEIVSRIKYSKIIHNKQSINDETKHEVVKNIKAMFMHKIGTVLVNTADSVIISAFIGVVVLGKYSNYTTIMASMVGVINLFFTPLTSVIGHMCVQEDNTQIIKYFNFFHTFNFIIGLIFFLGYYSVIDNLVVLCFGAEDLVLQKTISFVITLDYFVQFMRQAALLFRDATGTFYNDRWKPLVEGIINIALSILLVVVLPDEYKVVGVIVATIITNMLICHIVEPHVLYKYAFKTSAKIYYVRNYLYIAVFVVALVGLHFCMVKMNNQWLQLLVNGCISLAFSFTICLVTIACNKDFRHYVKKFLIKLKLVKH
jgi:O-antigen/teichoic acid export membrane protein